MIERPNLAREPFVDLRPVAVAGIALAVLAVVLTTVSVVEIASAKGEEQALAGRLRELQTRRTDLSRQVVEIDRKLAGESWKKLDRETESLRQVVAQRRLAWSDLLADLEKVVPWDVRLVSIAPSLSDKGEITVSLSGIAAGRAGWLKLLAAFFNSDKFSSPVPGSEDAPGAGNTVGYRFQLRVRYWPEGRS